MVRCSPFYKDNSYLSVMVKIGLKFYVVWVLLTIGFLAGNAQVIVHEWADAVPRSVTNSKSEFVFGKSSINSGLLMARMVEWETAISLSNYGTSLITRVDPMGVNDTLFTVGSRAHVLALTSTAYIDYMLLRYTDTLLVGDSLLAIGQAWTPEEVIVAIHPTTHEILWTQQMDKMNDMQLYQNRLTVLCSDFGGSVLRVLDGQNGQELDSIYIESVLVGHLDLDQSGSMYVSGLVSAYDTVKVGTFNQYVGGTGLHVCALKVDTLGNGRWIKSSTDNSYGIPHILCDKRGSVWLAGDLFGPQIWGQDTLEGSQWVYDFFLVSIDTSGNVQGAWETPNTQTLTGDYQLATRQPLAASDSSVILMLTNRGGVAFDGMLPDGGSTNLQDRGITFLEYANEYERGVTYSGGQGGYIQASGMASFDGGFHALWGAGVSYSDSLDCLQSLVDLDSLYNDVYGVMRFTHIVGLPNSPHSGMHQYIYPNPTSGAIQANRPWSSDEQVIIYSALGRKVFEGHPDDWNMLAHKAGLYILLRSTGEMYRFIVQY